LEKTKKLISSHLSKYENFDYYLSIIGVAEKSLNKHPDISIDSCKSLIEGVSKTILINIDSNYAKNNEEVNRPSAIKLFNKATKQLIKYDKTLLSGEPEFIEQSRLLVETIIDLRNKRGDLSHGKFVPKPDEIISTTEFGTFVMHITDVVLSFMLQTFFSIKSTLEKKIEYSSEELEPYNEWLDKRVDLPITKINFSKSLYDNNYDEYVKIYEIDYKDEVVIEDDLVEMDEAEMGVAEMGVAEMSSDAELLVANSFNSDVFWTEKRKERLQEFANEYDFDIDGLITIIEDYLIYNKDPLRDDVRKIMLHPPSLEDRRAVLIVMSEFITELADELKELKSK